MSIEKPAMERFMEKVIKQPSGCWEWQGFITSQGYGQFFCDGRLVTAHRFSYEQVNTAIPDGFTLDHLCRNRKCVNPDHLEIVTLRENILRGVGNAAVNVRKTHCIYGHPYDASNTYVNKHGERICLACKRRRYLESKKRNRDLKFKYLKADGKQGGFTDDELKALRHIACDDTIG